MSTIDEAAARLRQHRLSWSEQYRDTQQGSDEAKLADEYLQLTDPAPITEEWIDSLGRKEGLLWIIYENEETRAEMSAWRNRGEFLFDWDLGEECVFYNMALTTRGQLRSLCRVLNITLNEVRTE